MVGLGRAAGCSAKVSRSAKRLPIFSRSARCAVGRLVGQRAQRQIEPEPRALAQFALQVDLAAVQLDQPLDQRQAQPGAAEFARRRAVDLHEPLEDPVALRLVDADAGVGDRDPHAVVGQVRFDADAAALGRELDGVRDQVADDRVDLFLVGAEGPQLRVAVDLQLDAALLGQRRGGLDQLVDQAVQIEPADGCSFICPASSFEKSNNRLIRSSSR